MRRRRFVTCLGALGLASFRHSRVAPAVIAGTTATPESPPTPYELATAFIDRVVISGDDEAFDELVDSSAPSASDLKWDMVELQARVRRDNGVIAAQYRMVVEDYVRGTCAVLGILTITAGPDEGDWEFVMFLQELYGQIAGIYWDMQQIED